MARKVDFRNGRPKLHQEEEDRKEDEQDPFAARLWKKQEGR